MYFYSGLIPQVKVEPGGSAKLCPETCISHTHTLAWSHSTKSVQILCEKGPDYLAAKHLSWTFFTDLISPYLITFNFYAYY